MNATQWNNITTFEQIISSANEHAPFWTTMFLMIWVTLVITFLPFGTSVAVYGGSFVSFFIGLFLVYMGVVDWKIVMIPIAIIILMIIWDTLHGKKE